MSAPSIHDVLVIGAGPAGAAAAWALARAGQRVALVDRETFPRDKTCGDGLIPDALGALDTMGLRETVMREAVEPRALHIVAPGGESVSLAGEFLCLTRLRLDALLVDAAVGAGAALMEPMSALQPIEDGRQVRGARFRALAGEREVRARFTLLATGANAVVSRAFGLATPSKPNAVAGRAYFNVPSSYAERYPHLSILCTTSLYVPATGGSFPDLATGTTWAWAPLPAAVVRHRACVASGIGSRRASRQRPSWWRSPKRSRNSAARRCAPACRTRRSDGRACWRSVTRRR